MSPSFEIRDVPLQPCVFIRRTFPRSEIGDFFMDALGKVYPHVGANVTKPCPPFGRYITLTDDRWTVEVGVAVATPMPEEGEFLSGTLGGHKAVVTEHVGPYDKLGSTWEALTAHVKENGYSSAGPPYEVYVEPGNQPGVPAKTEIYWPIA